MDDFKRQCYQHHVLGPGGYYCPCCNPYFKATMAKKHILSKFSRRKLKLETERIRKTVDDYAL